MRRITKPLALFLALVMIVGLLPMTALAVDGTQASVAITATGGWGTYAQTGEVALTFGKTGNKVKVWVNDGTHSSQGVNISAITVDGTTQTLNASAVSAQGGAAFNGSTIENMNNAGAYAVIDLDALGFGDLSGERTVSFTYATTDDNFSLNVASSYDEEQPEPSTEPSTEPATEPPATGYQKITVTGIEATGGWDSTNTNYQNWFEISDVQLDPSGTVTVSGNGRGINIAAVEINGQKISVTQMKDSGTVTVNGEDSSGNAVDLEQQAGGWQIAHLELSGVSAAINLSQFGLTSGVYGIRFYYAISGTAADLIVESSAGEGETTAAYDSISHGSLGGSVTPPTGESSTTPARKGIKDNDQTNPQKAVWFFDSHKETKSFNQANDTYEDELKSGLHQNDLILYASTDGAVRNTGTNGELRINWENQYRASSPEVGGRVMTGDGYTDGSYTVVGWGGEFEGGDNKVKNAIRFRIKDDGDGTLVDALSHMTTYLVDKEGKIVDKVRITGNDSETDSLHYVSTTDDGYHIYEATLNGSHSVQGIKLAFDRYSQSESFSENAATHHSGTLIIGNVEIQVNDEWVDFGPFDYYNDDGNYENPYKSPVTSGSRPFLRSAHYKSTLQQGAHEGYNLANKQTGYDWHIWTMSTSDANIVNNAYSNADALQIKYSNTDQHTTYTHLVGAQELSGEWLVMTLGGEVDANTRFQLVSSSAASTTDAADVSATLSLSDFRTAKDDNAEAVTADLFSDDNYHTIYYHMKGETFRSVYVDFENVADVPGDASRYMYITEVYLLEPAAKIEKAVDREEAATGDELTYTLTVTNNDEQPITQFTVTDTLPDGVSFVSSNPAAVLGADGKTVTWNYSGDAFTTGQSKVLTVTVKVDAGFQGTLVNSGAITSLNHKTQAIGSNRVSTVVTAKTPEEFVFYAEVGQKTTLPISLGSTANATTTTGTVEKFVRSVTLGSDGNYRTSQGTFTLDSTGNVKIVRGSYGGISLRAITLDGNNILWMENKQTKTDSNVSIVGTVSRFDQSDSIAGGEINNLNDAYILITGLSAGTHTIEFNCRGWDGAAMDLYAVTQETTTVTGDPTPDIVAAVPTLSENSNAIDANGIVGQNSGSLLYTSTATGKDTFELTYNPGGDTAKTQTAKVTVYNYKVDDHVYVLDYGLPVNLTNGSSGFFRDATLSLEGDDTGYAFAGLSGEKRNADSVADAGDYATPYGSATLERSNGRADWNGMPNLDSLSVSFTPTTFMSSIDTFYYGVQVSKNGTVASDATNATPVMEGQIKVMPANVVYYEDNFSHSGTDSADGTNGIIYTGANSVGGEDTFHWQTNDQDSVYGYDEEAYKDAVESFSNGNAHELSINDTASFTFQGTGFDIIGRTNNKTGIIMAMIYSVDEAGNTTFDKFIVVDTYYENGDLYQIPVISVLNLAYGTHKVVLYSMRGYADEYAGQTSTVYIDGVRIYNPLGEDGDEAYGEEQGAEFTEIKSMIFGSNFNYDRNEPQNSTWTDDAPDGVMATLVKYNAVDDVYLNGSTLVEILKNRNDAGEAAETAPGGTYDLLTYAFSGPNKELYLEDGYGIGFMPDGSGLLQIGVKLISKPANTYPTIQYLDADGGWKTLCVVDSSTEKYYSLEEIVADGDIFDGTLTLRVDGPGIVSLTNIKSKGYEFYPVTTEADNNDDPTQMIVLKQEDLKVISGYRNGKFAAGLINIRVTTAVADDIASVKVFDMDGNEIVLQSMTFKDNGETRTWTIKFKAKAAAENYKIQVFNSSGNFSNQVNVK